MEKGRLFCLPSKGTPNNPICWGVKLGGIMDMDFEVLVKKLSPTLKRITYKLNGHFTFFNDEDLFQEALIHLLQDFRAGRLQDKTDSYILQGCYFHLKNYIRKVNERPNVISFDASLGANDEATVKDILGKY